jgi:Domain of unknown function (DUF4389)
LSGTYPGYAGLPPSRYPLDLTAIAPERVARWRPLFNWLLVIPLSIWSRVLQLGASVVAILGWFVIVATGRLPETWSDYLIAVLRYEFRIEAYLYGWTTIYPGFAVVAGQLDPGDQPAILYCSRPGPRSRFTVAIRLLMFVPQLVVLAFVWIAGGAALIAGWISVLVLGRWPAGLREFSIGVVRWSFRAWGYVLLVTDVYPPFTIHS